MIDGKRMKIKRQTGFTLIELLVVIAINPSKGFSVLFADGSAKFISSQSALKIVLSGTFTTVQTLQSCTDYDKLFDALENSD